MLLTRAVDPDMHESNSAASADDNNDLLELRPQDHPCGGCRQSLYQQCHLFWNGGLHIARQVHRGLHRHQRGQDLTHAVPDNRPSSKLIQIELGGRFTQSGATAEALKPCCRAMAVIRGKPEVTSSTTPFSLAASGSTAGSGALNGERPTGTQCSGNLPPLNASASGMQGDFALP
eukprot:1030673-Amphidinium_carterae.2